MSRERVEAEIRHGDLVTLSIEREGVTEHYFIEKTTRSIPYDRHDVPVTTLHLVRLKVMQRKGAENAKPDVSEGVKPWVKGLILR